MTDSKPKKNKVTTTEIVLFALVLALSSAIAYLQTGKKPQEWDKVTSISNRVIADLSDSGWNPETVEEYATPALKNWVKTSKDLDKLNEALAKLGAIKKNNGIVAILVNKKIGITASEIEYTNGKAEITVRYKKDGDKWLVDTINVNSPELAQSGTAAQPAPAAQ